jgi:hypothetical protein
MDAMFLKQEFEAGLTYEPYVATGNDSQQQRWRAVYDAASLTDAQRRLASSFTRRMNLLIVSGVWCGDCIEQVPLIQRIAQANPDNIAVRIVDRDQHADLSSQIKLNGGGRVPVVLFLAEDFELCGWFGDRTLSRYRALAAKNIGPACSLGAVVPPAEQVAATLADWLDEIERVQLMLRLSPRLRQKYGD